MMLIFWCISFSVATIWMTLWNLKIPKMLVVLKELDNWLYRPKLITKYLKGQYE